MSHPDRFLLAGVMGWPVLHSRSPLLHNHWFQTYGLAGAYVPLAIEPGTLGPALRALHPLKFAGCNLTIPHKEAALAIVDEIHSTAKLMGAISCVSVGKDGQLIGSNNDGYGFIESILEAHPDWRADQGPIVVMGAGGGARAVIFSLAERGAKEIRVINRTFARAKTLQDSFGGPVKAYPWDDRAQALSDCAMLVNTTSQGMVGMAPLDLSLATLHRSALVADIIYIPRETPLLKQARERGNPTLNGLGMLLHQARPAWQAWFQRDPQVTPQLRALLDATLS
jgi:shikimate dehydrogenase